MLFVSDVDHVRCAVPPAVDVMVHLVDEFTLSEVESHLRIRRVIVAVDLSAMASPLASVNVKANTGRVSPLAIEKSAVDARIVS